VKAPAKDQKLECVWDVMEGECEGAKLLGARLSSIGRGRFVAPRVVLWLESTDLRMTGVERQKILTDPSAIRTYA
jgi:hypothetical protein